jgi:hypothetical protein
MIGKPKTFKTPDDLWNYFLKYVEYVKNNPLLVHDYVGKDGNSVYREKQRPLTFQGFEVWLSQEGVIKYPDLSDYCDGKNPSYADYLHITRAIKKACSVSRIEGAMAGIFNANLAARLDGLNDEEKKDKPGYTIPQITIKYESNGTGTGTTPSEADGE